MYFVVTALAEAHKVASCMGTSLRDRFDVMNLLDRGEFSFFQTHLAQRMLRSVAVTDTLPCSAVGFVYVWVTLVLVVTFPFHLPVFLAILSVRQVGTAGV